MKPFLSADSVLVLFSLLTASTSFHSLPAVLNRWSTPSRSRPFLTNDFPRPPPFLSAHEASPIQLDVKSSRSENSDDEDENTLRSTIDRLCEAGSLGSALELLESITQSPFPSFNVYYRVVHEIAADEEDPNSIENAERLLQRMKAIASNCSDNVFLTPTCQVYNQVILAWSKSFRRDAGPRCLHLLRELWSHYNSTGDERFLPTESTYVSTLTALARSGRGRQAAEQAESLLEEMERVRVQHPFLAPTTICVNIVLDAWSKSGDRRASERCTTILKRMEELCFSGRTELQPDTTSFNTALNALAHSKESGSSNSAEQLLEHMDALSSSYSNEGLRLTCRPDNLSFNIVLKSWSRSDGPRGARRADDILRHMQRRFEDGNTDIQPDVSTYNTVLTAWSRSPASDALERSQNVLRRMEDAYRSGNSRARPNAMTYNIMINALAKAEGPESANRAVEMLSFMKRLSTEEGREDCRPDVYSYTAACDALAKLSTEEATRTAENLLQELEDQYKKTGDIALKPNLRVYTSVIHAIARSRSDPERAERIVERLEHLYESGSTDLQPDVVCYDALINAFGWSSLPGRSKKCYQIFQKMLKGSKAGSNVDAKPDIITCNSVLNACAFEEVETSEEKVEMMRMVVDTFETFQTKAPKFGWPNHMTYAHVLLAISKHMDPDDDRRDDLVEATYWQCCQNGHVSVLVVTQLHRALPWDRFAKLMGEALFSKEDEKLGFNLRKLPQEWTRFAPRPKQKQNSRPSKRIPSLEVTKLFVAKQKKREV